MRILRDGTEQRDRGPTQSETDKSTDLSEWRECPQSPRAGANVFLGTAARQATNDFPSGVHKIIPARCAKRLPCARKGLCSLSAFVCDQAVSAPARRNETYR